MDAHTKGTFEWNLLKPYRNAMTGCTMVVIQCPHCGKNVELGDGPSGLFDCPYCNKDLEWNEEAHNNDLKVKFSLFLFGIFSPSLIFFVSFWIMLSVGDSEGLAEVGYLAISLLICTIYTLSLAIYGGSTKKRTLLQGVLLSLVASCLIIYAFVENL